MAVVRALFAEILKGAPGLINVVITSMSVVLLTGVAGRLGKEVAIGYAMGARLEQILLPLGFGFGTAIVAMVGTNWGAKQYRRAREIVGPVNHWDRNLCRGRIDCCVPSGSVAGPVQ